MKRVLKSISFWTVYRAWDQPSRSHSSGGSHPFPDLTSPVFSVHEYPTSKSALDLMQFAAAARYGRIEVRDGDPHHTGGVTAVGRSAKMNARMWIVLGVVGLVSLLAVPILAQPYAPSFIMPGPGHMSSGGSATGGRSITIEQAATIARQFLAKGGYVALTLDEIQEFSNNFYVAVKYKSGNQGGAFEFLVDRYTGVVHPEPQTMMWNTQFGHMIGWGGYGPDGMMGGGYGHGGMMGGYGQGTRGGPAVESAPTVQPQVRPAQAKTIAQTFLNTQFPGTKVRNVDAFPGYYTLDVTRDGKVVGMLSVHAYTGQVWFHRWHGTFVQEKDFN